MTVPLSVNDHFPAVPACEHSSEPCANAIELTLATKMTAKAVRAILQFMGVLLPQVVRNLAGILPARALLHLHKMKFRGKSAHVAKINFSHGNAKEPRQRLI